MKHPVIIVSLIAGLALFLMAAVVSLLVWLYTSRVSNPNPTSVLLSSRDGQRYVGEQLQFFDVAADGVITATNDDWLNLYHTEGKPFRLSGEILLGTRPDGAEYHKDFPDGFALFLREWDSLHRYTVTTRYLQTKRRRYAEVEAPDIVRHVTFPQPQSGIWIPFHATVTSNAIEFRIAEQSGSIPGPLEVNGANKILIGAGCRARNLRLELLPANHAN